MKIHGGIRGARQGRRWRRQIALTAIGCILTTAFSMAQDNAAADTRTIAEKYITPEAVKPLIFELALDSYEGRGAGYKGERKAADYLAKQYVALGLKPMGDITRGSRSFLQGFSFYPHAPIHPFEQLRSQNVVAMIEGSDPVLKNEVVVVGAHYDGQGRSGQADAGPRNILATDRGDEIWNSANDNLSSCSAILAIARAFKEGHLQPKRSILFIAFGAEEHEMSGSIFYVNSSALASLKHVAMINLECLGGQPTKPLRVDAIMTGGFWNGAIQNANKEMGTAVQPNIPVPIPDSDHYPFSSARIASIVVSGGEDPDRHRPTDTADKVDAARTAEAARFAFGLLADLANRSESPRFIQCPMPDLGVTADLATPAECEYLHLDKDQGCLRVTNIVNGRPGEKAGFHAGDAMLGFYTAPANGEPQHITFRRDEKLSELQGMLESILRGKLGKQIRATVLRDGRRFELVLPISS